MNNLRISFSSLPLLKTLPHPPTPKPAIIAAKSPRHQVFRRFLIMNSSSKLDSRPSSSLACQVPGLESEEMDRIAEQMFRRYSSPSSSGIKRGKGVAIVWFRNDLRLLDNEALYKAWISSEAVLPVYCVDPRLFGSTCYFGFPKPGGLFLNSLFNPVADDRVLCYEFMRRLSCRVLNQGVLIIFVVVIDHEAVLYRFLFPCN